MRTEASATIERFEDLIVWQKARVLTQEIYRITKQGAFAADRGLHWQIQSAAVSVMSNIAEGFERGKPSEFHQFVCVAKASCAEVRSQLYVALDIGYIEQKDFQAIQRSAEEVGRLLGGLRSALERKAQTNRQRTTP